jgi:hypothetical protein
MRRLALQPILNWAEDTALAEEQPERRSSGRDRRAGGDCSQRRPRFFPPLRDRHQSVKPSRQDAATPQAGCTPTFANARHPEFQFTLNQYSLRRLGIGHLLP